MKKLACLLLAALSISFAGSLSEIKSSNTIRIGVLEHQAPLSKMNRDGSFQGFEVDLAKELARAILGTGGKIQFIGIPANKRMDAITSNKVDILVANYARNAERAKQAAFSIPYMSTELATVSKKTDKIHRVSDLNGKKVLTIHESNADQWLQKQPNIGQILYCENNHDCFNKLNEGEADVYMHNIMSVAAVALLEDDYEIGIKRIGQVFFNCVATQKNNHDLIHIIDETILKLAKEEYFHDEYAETFEPFFKGTVDEKLFILEDLYEAFE